MTVTDSHQNRNGEGERRRNTGTRRAAANRPAVTLALQLRALDLARSGATFTIDDISDPSELTGAFPDRGPFRGAAILGLASKKLISKTGELRKSQRDHRHAGTNPVWRAIAPSEVLDAEAAAIREELRAGPPPSDDIGFYSI